MESKLRATVACYERGGAYLVSHLNRSMNALQRDRMVDRLVANSAWVPTAAGIQWVRDHPEKTR